MHDRKRTNLLHAACEMGHAELASALIGRYKMAVEEPDRKGLTPLARAAQRNQVRLLIMRNPVVTPRVKLIFASTVSSGQHDSYVSIQSGSFVLPSGEPQLDRGWGCVWGIVFFSVAYHTRKIMWIRVS